MNLVNRYRERQFHKKYCPQVRSRCMPGSPYDDKYEILLAIPRQKNRYDRLPVDTKPLTLSIMSNHLGVRLKERGELTKGCYIDLLDDDIVLFRSEDQARKFIPKLVNATVKNI